MIVQDVDLFMREGASDKVYRVQLEEHPDGFAVNAFNGRRGSRLTQQAKGSGLPKAEAEKLFAKIVNEKTRKGYKPAEGATGTVMESIRERNDTGLRPQLLNAVDRAEALRLCEDPAFWMQRKYDGIRAMIRKSGMEVIAANRNGLHTSIDSALSAHVMEHPENVVLDGELVGTTLYAFDLLEDGDVDMRSEPYEARYSKLSTLHLDAHNLVVVYTYESTEQKLAAFAALEAEGAEGVVFKCRTAPVSAGRPASGGSQLKFKYYETCSAIVSRLNQQRSVGLDLFDAAGERVDVGNVTIAPNKTIPPVEAIVEIRYLYAYPSGSLYQSNYLGVRSDINPDECVLSQLKFKTAE